MTSWKPVYLKVIRCSTRELVRASLVSSKTKFYITPEKLGHFECPKHFTKATSREGPPKEDWTVNELADFLRGHQILMVCQAD
jgi:hypothetical protein